MSEAEEIAVAVVNALESAREISHDKHNRDHDYIGVLINRDTKRAEMYDQVKLHMVKFGALGIFGAIGMAMWHYFTEIVHNGGVPPH